MNDQAQSAGSARGTLPPGLPRRLLIVGTVLFSVGILVVDTLTALGVVVPVLYVAVVVVAARLFRTRGLLLATAACVALTVFSAFLTPSRGASAEGVSNILISIAAIVLTSVLLLQGKSGESKLRENARLLDLTHDGIFTRKLDGTIKTWNRGAQELYGWTAEEAVGSVSHQLLKTAFPVPRERIEEEVLSTGRWEGELCHTRKDGSQLVVDSRWTLQRDESGAAVGHLETNNDITRRKQFEQDLRRSEQELRNVLQTIPVFAYSASPDGAIEFVSGRWLEYTRLTQDDLKGGEWQTSLHPEDVRRYVDTRTASFSRGEAFEIECRIRRGADGEFRWFRNRAVPLRDEQGKIIRWYGVMIDVEDWKRLEEERERLHRLQAELAHLGRVTTMGELSASFAHELNQPITAMVASASACVRWLARNPPEIDEAKEVAARIARDGTRAGELIKRLRSLYRKEAAKRRDPVDLNETVSEMVGLLRNEAAHRGVTIRTDLAPGLREIRADRIQLQQVLMNLMLNGMEAMEDTGGELLVRSRLLEEGQVAVSVSDTGVGLPADATHRLFDPFFTTKADGTGMGLAISRSIIESHQGRLWAAANEARGATFHFALPADSGPEPATRVR